MAELKNRDAVTVGEFNPRKVSAKTNLHEQSGTLFGRRFLHFLHHLHIHLAIIFCPKVPNHG